MQVHDCLINLLRMAKTEENVERYFVQFEVNDFLDRVKYIRYAMDTDKLFYEINTRENYRLCLQALIEYNNRKQQK